MAIDLLIKFSVTSQSREGIEVFDKILIDGERVELSYKNTRDKLIFTNDRIIAYDVQGMLGTKKSFRIFPYSKLTSFMIETAGTLDSDGDLKIWLSGVGEFEIKFGKGIDIMIIGKFLSEKLLIGN